MNSESKPYRPGQATFLFTVIGAFVGLLIGKFALGLIFGFFIGLAAESARRRAASATGPAKDISEDQEAT